MSEDLPVRMLRTVACTKARRLPGVRCWLSSTTAMSPVQLIALPRRRSLSVGMKNMFPPQSSKRAVLAVSFAVAVWWSVALDSARAGAGDVSQSPPSTEKRTEPTSHPDKKNHWSFRAPAEPPIPEVKDKKWARNAIDNFVLARLDKENLRPAPQADRVTLVRRSSLDLTGLPPTIQEVDECL